MNQNRAGDPMSDLDQFFHCIFSNDYDGVSEFLRKGIDPNVRWESEGDLIPDEWARGARPGPTPLHVAAMAGHCAIIDRLMTAGADPVMTQGRARNTPHHLIALGVRKREPFKMALGNLKKGPKGIAEFDLPNADGYTPLCIAAGALNHEAVKILLGMGANPGQYNGEVESMHNVAEWEWKPSVLDFFSSALLGNMHRSPGDAGKIFHLLSSACRAAGIPQPNNVHRLMPVFCDDAIQFRHAIDHALGKGTDSDDAKDMMRAAVDGPWPAMMEVLLAGGIDPDAVLESGRRPLHLLCNGESVHWAGNRLARAHGAVAVLLDAGADVNGLTLKGDWRAGDGKADERYSSLGAMHPEGETPLHVATRTLNHPAMRCLIEAGADQGIRNSWGDTPLDAARGLARTSAMSGNMGGKFKSVSILSDAMA